MKENFTMKVNRNKTELIRENDSQTNKHCVFNVNSSLESKLEIISKEDEYENDYDVYRFDDSGIGNSWLLGDDSSNSANAYIGGYSKCPVKITVPRSLTNEKGETKPVEVIGQWAYDTCGHPGYGNETKAVLVTKQVRIIKNRGFGYMYNVESFRIEEGSVLESIEVSGMHYIGYTTGQIYGDKRGTLTLPSTLSSVARLGFYDCNLFKEIIYCGIHSLTNSCELEWNVGEMTKVKVTDQYSAGTIFGRTPLKDSPTEVEGNCSIMEMRPTPTPSLSPTHSCNCPHSNIQRVSLRFVSIIATLLSSHNFSFYPSISTHSSSISNLFKFVPSFKASKEFHWN